MKNNCRISFTQRIGIEICGRSFESYQAPLVLEALQVSRGEKVEK
jgi:hypothetical protein